MSARTRNVLVVGGGTSGAVLAARLSEDSDRSVTLLEAGPDHDAYADVHLEPSRASQNWGGEGEHLVPTQMTLGAGGPTMVQGRLLGGTSAINGMATLRGQPADYDAWAAAGLDGWGWKDVESTFVAAERDHDFGESPIHGSDGPLPVRRWRRDEMSRSQLAFYDGMVETGQPTTPDINDPSRLPGLGIFPVTIDEERRRVSTSLAYLTDAVRARDNLTIRTGAEVATIAIEAGVARGVVLTSGEMIEADEVVVTAGAIWSATMLLRSGVGPAAHLAEHDIRVHADLPVGSTMSDHLGPGLAYLHGGARGGVGGPAQVVFVGASNGRDVDYHLMPISVQDEVATPPDGPTIFLLAVFLLRSSHLGSVRLGATPTDEPIVAAPPFPDDTPARLRHAFDQLVAWERSDAFASAGIQPVEAHDLSAVDAVAAAIERNTISYGHMVGTCPMGPVLDADCRVHGVANLRIADASVMPTIPAGNTYLGCVMVAERIAAKMRAESRG